MWLYKYLVCLFKKHPFIPLHLGGVSYQYCLRCGKLAAEAVGGSHVVTPEPVVTRS